MKKTSTRLAALAATAIAIGLGTAGTAQARSIVYIADYSSMWQCNNALAFYEAANGLTHTYADLWCEQHSSVDFELEALTY